MNTRHLLCTCSQLHPCPIHHEPKPKPELGRLKTADEIDAAIDASQCSKANLQAQAVVTAAALRSLADVMSGERRDVPERYIRAIESHADALDKAVKESNRA